MKVDLQKPDSWEQLNEIYREALGVQASEVSVRAYLGMQHAVWEIGQGLAQLFPHRKTVAFFSQGGPYFEATMTALSREGYTAKTLTLQDLQQPQDWLEPLAKDLLFVFCAVDDPLTGELFDLTAFNEATKDKRIFRVYLSHVWHRHQPSPLAPASHEIHILSLRRDRAVAVIGERARINPVLAPGLYWEPVTVVEAKVDLAEAPSNREDVEAFESNLPAGARAFFKAGTPRIYDRAVIYWDDMDGFSLISELAHQSGFSLHEPGQDARLETASLCRWGSAQLTDWLKNRGADSKVLRGLVVIGSHLLTPEFAGKIEKARKRLLEVQNG